MSAPQRYSVVVSKDYLKFAAAHFIAYPGFREPLHGHNYQVSVRVEAEHSSRVGIEIETDEGALVVRSTGRWGGMSVIDYKLTVPAWMALELGGVNTDILVSGTRADVKAETVSGDVSVTGGKGYIELSSFQGDVQLSGGSGKASLSAVNNGVSVDNFAGELSVETVNGDVVVTRVDAVTLDAGTVNGSVEFQGKVRDGIRLCEHAIKLQFYEAENHFNMARVQHLAGERMASVNAIERGLKLDPDHEGLLALKREVGVRRPPVLGFLDRKNPVNVFLGRVRQALSGPKP